ncbi:hypothetical protein K3495_g4927 [Podosphaera aphanis]|nr:hypothetical protein K3495_g4927 [Podosphaera aphanis]
MVNRLMKDNIDRDDPSLRRGRNDLHRPGSRQSDLVRVDKTDPIEDGYEKYAFSPTHSVVGYTKETRFDPAVRSNAPLFESVRDYGNDVVSENPSTSGIRFSALRPYEQPNRPIGRDTPFRSSVQPGYRGPRFSLGVYLGDSPKIKVEGPKIFAGNEEDKHLFEPWRIGILGKIRALSSQWGSKEHIMHHIFVNTTGEAQSHLLPYYQTGNPDIDFSNAQEMLEHLIHIYRSSTERRDNFRLFEQMRQGDNEPFQSFKSRFLRISGKAEISQANRLDQIYDKMNRRLRVRFADRLHTFVDFNDFCSAVEPADKELTRLKNEENARQLANSTPPNRPALLRKSADRKVTDAFPAELFNNAVSRPNLRDIKGANSKNSQPPSDYACYQCKKVGDHYWNQCPLRRTHIQEIERNSSEGEQE